MNLDDAKELWSSENDPDTPSMSASTLSDSDILRLVKEKAESLDQRIRRRDLLESIAAVAIVLFFGWIALQASSWWIRSGAGMVMAGSVFIFWRLRRARTRYDDPSPDRPVAEVIRTQRAKVEEQMRLLDNVLWWYLAPLTVGVLLIIFGNDGWSWATLLQTAVVLAFSAVIYELNQRGLRRTFEPRHEELTRLLEQVEEEDRS
jgi:membrane protein implicated in regulation of membrane protease activity